MVGKFKYESYVNTSEITGFKNTKYVILNLYKNFSSYTQNKIDCTDILWKSLDFFYTVSWNVAQKQPTPRGRFSHKGCSTSMSHL